MAFTYRAGLTLSTDAGTFTSDTVTITGSGSQRISESCPTGATTITVNVDVSAVKAFGMKSTEDCTVTVNDDGTPDATISLTANQGLTWVASLAGTQYPTDNPLGTVDVTSMKVTVAGADTATFTFACLTDATP